MMVRKVDWEGYDKKFEKSAMKRLASRSAKRIGRHPLSNSAICVRSKFVGGGAR
jgi:hypothetical protein